MTGSEESEHIVKYDLNSPFTLSPAVIMQIKNMSNKNAAALSSFLSSAAHTPFEVFLCRCSELTFSDYQNIYHDGTSIVSVITSEFSKSRLVISADCNMTSIILDCVLGNHTPGPYSIERVSDLERLLCEKFLSSLLKYADNLFSGYDISLSEAVHERNYSRDNSKQTWAVCSYRVCTGSVSGVLSFCIPSVFINKMIKNDALPDMPDTKITGSLKENAKSSPDSSIAEAVRNSAVTVKGVITGTEVTLRDILSLHSGDIITLDAPVNRNAEVLVDGVHVFDAQPGMKSKNKALKITKVYDNQ
ncbi:MAG: FliM/FliN family flagellar motor switch protein [Oscillospiraceae bacterium]|nr:FliM/FliN family flagellar motor switch protein [Oscillospiraceae bacterium]